MNNNRIPKSYEGLLRFCTEQTASEDTTRPSEFEPLSNEKREFLQKVFDSLSKNDPIKRILEIIKNLMHDMHLHSENGYHTINGIANAGENSVTTSNLGPSNSQECINQNAENNFEEDSEFVINKESLIEKLIDYCEDIDLANDFHKIGGFIILKPLLGSRIQSLKALTCELIATLSQNNPYSQQSLLNEDILPHLMHLLSPTNDSCTSEVKIKAMYAVSCLSRFNKPLQDELLHINLLPLILNLVNSDILKLQNKAAFLIGSLAEENDSIKNCLRCINACNTIIVILLKTTSNELKEHLIYALSRILRRNEDVAATVEDLNSNKLIQYKDELVVFIRNEMVNKKDDFSDAYKDNLNEIEILLGI